MTSLFDKLNLRPQERRLVVIVAIVVFAVVNFVFVFPNFGAFGIYEQRTTDVGKKLDLYNSEIAKQSQYQREIANLQAQGSTVASEEQALTLAGDVVSQANLCGVSYTSMSPAQRGFGGSSGKTNAFFEESSVVLNVTCGEKELIDFLYRLADKELLIRAKSMQISPDPQSRQRLQGPITLVKSFQRKQAPRSFTASTIPASAPPAAKPATTNKPVVTNVAAATPPRTNLASQVPRVIPGASSTNQAVRTPPTNPAVRTLIPPGAPGGTNRMLRRPPTPLVPPPK